MADKVHMRPTLDVLCEVFDERHDQVKDSRVPAWPWMDDEGKPHIPDGPGERTYDNYRKAAAFLLYKMEVHRGDWSELRREPELEEVDG